jgi:IPT/TIG domain/PASTA domain
MGRRQVGHYAQRGTHGRLGSRWRIALVAASMVCACALPQAGAAQASTVSIGSVLPLTYTLTPFGQVQTQFNTTLPETGAKLTSPVDGAIVRWRMLGAKGGPFYLRVLRPNGSGAFRATESSTAATPIGEGLQTFSTNVPVKAGDQIGIDPTNPTDEIGVATVPGAGYAFIFPTPFNGATVAPSGTETGKEIELSAEVQPAPSVDSLENFSGSIAGGTVVKIKGDDLNGASGVKFGAKPAASYSVESENLITATSPRSSVAGFVDVTVTTLAGTSPTVRSDRFRYEGCVVPKLIGKDLRATRKALAKADCKLGKVKGKGKVVRQSPKPRKVKLPGAKVDVKLEPVKKGAKDTK